MSNKITNSTELRQQHQALYDAICSGIPEKVEDFYSHDPQAFFVGTDEIWTNITKHNEDNKPYWQKGNRIESKDIIARQRGDVGWSFDELTHNIVTTGEAFHMRISLVWVKETDGHWRIVYSHSDEVS